MAKGYWEAKKYQCNYCGETKKELRKTHHRTILCKKCAQQNRYEWEKLKPSPPGGDAPGKEKKHECLYSRKGNHRQNCDLYP